MMLKDLNESSFVDYRLAIGQLIVSGVKCEWVRATDEVRHAHILLHDGTMIFAFRDGASYKIKSETIRDLCGH